MRISNYKKRKICIVTSNRADYGHLKNVIFKVHNSKSSILKLIVSGSHLSKKHGYSINEIYKDKLPITSKIVLNINNDFNKKRIIGTLSKSLVKFDKVINKINPDIILILGDRYEILPVAQIALFRNIPLAHIHGGEVTSGVLDEQIRHAVTKFSDINLINDREPTKPRYKREKDLKALEMEKKKLEKKLKEEKKMLKMEEKFNVLSMIDNSILQDTNRIVQTKPIKKTETYEIPRKQNLNKTINHYSDIIEKEINSEISKNEDKLYVLIPK